jgi:hypothetical protein
MPEPFDPVDVLQTHVRAVALLERPRDDPDDLIERITSAAVSATVVPLRTPRRRRWWVAGAATTIVVVGGAGVAAWVGARPAEQIRDVLCRPGADRSGSGLAVVAGDDPIGACAELWRSGAMAEQAGVADTGGLAPRLVACTGTGRPIEVYPLADGAGCASLGLLDADVTANETDAVVALRTFVVEMDRMSDCLSSDRLARAVDDQLSSLGLDAWSVVVEGDARCALAGVEAGRTTVRILPDPLAPPLLEEP